MQVATTRAAASRLALRPQPIGARPSTSAPVPLRSLAPGPDSRQRPVCAATSGRPGGAVIDAPGVWTAPVLHKGTSGSTKRPPIYKLMLHNDTYNRREYVVKVLLKVVNGLTKDDAVNVMQEAHETGVAMVLACPQDEAENYCESLRLNGLSCSIEPGC